MIPLVNDTGVCENNYNKYNMGDDLPLNSHAAQKNLQTYCWVKKIKYILIAY